MNRQTLFVAGLLLLAIPVAVGAADSGRIATEPVHASIASSDSPPSAAFTYSPSTPNPDETITLDASDSSDNGSIVSYEWDTDGDGYYDDYDDAPSGETTTVSYDSGGTYTVGLKITDDTGNTETVTKQVTVDNPEPTAAFEFTPSVPNPDDSITLDASDSSDSDGSITTYEWDTDGDGYYDDYDDAPNGETTTVTYGSGGTYTVGLRVEDNGGAVTTVRKQITVDNPEPTATFEFSPSVPNPDDSITLDASDSSDPDGSITSYEWDTDGDGYYDDYDDAPSGETTTESYDSGGTYTVGLRVEDNGGKTVTKRKEITVENPAPTASFTVSPSTPNPDDTITLDASDSSDPDGTITSYEWDTDGDGYYDDYDDAPSGETTTESYDSGGTYTIGLRVTDNGGKTVTKRKEITVENPAPTASFTASPSTPNPDDAVTLDASDSSDPDGTITSYEWDTDGDGYYDDYDDADNGRTTRGTFESGGTYTVGLKVTDNGGKTDTVTKQITVENPPPSVNITFSPTAPTPGEAITLDASGSSDPDGTIMSYEWDTDGDGDYDDYTDASAGQTTTITYNSAGSHRVSLRVTDNGGVSSTTTTTVPVSLPPEPELDISTSTAGQNRPVTFDAGSSTDADGTITNYIWQFSDGKTKRGKSIERSFSNLGRHEVTLIVVDDTGHRVERSETVTVYPTPSAEITADPAEPIAGSSVRLKAHSTDNIDQYEWDVDGDGITDKKGAEITHIFENSGEHRVTVTATNTDGITSETSRVVTVDPDASFELTSNLETVKAGETAVVTYSVTNNIPDRSVDARLQLDLPSTGVSIASVEGGSVESRSSTGFVTVSGGEQKSLRVRMRFNEPGDYDISAQSAYYYGNQSNIQQTSIEPISVTVTDDETSESTPGFGPVSVLIAIALGASSVAVRKMCR
ncbi:PKD domain-containing protein [Natrinema sp. HArc-T2]|uniref:PKD domain-containing protein n=1 Tax=Natrinema sp. HArc-T2 TaxID=3242701 RepID=UPI00359E3E1C